MSRFETIADKKYMMLHVRNPAFQWGSWGKNPRQGARWAAVEDRMFVDTIKTFAAEANGEGLRKADLCRLSTLHGRSIESIRVRAIKVLGSAKFEELFYGDAL